MRNVRKRSISWTSRLTSLLRVIHGAMTQGRGVGDQGVDASRDGAAYLAHMTVYVVDRRARGLRPGIG